MKSGIGIVAVTLFAAAATSAIAVGSASADEWFIEGAKLTAGKSAALATSAPVDEFAKFRVNPGNAEEVQIECKGANLVGEEAYISSGTGGMAKSLTFEGCSVTKFPSGSTCALEGQPRNISTAALGITTLLTGPNTKVSINFHSLTKRTFVEVNFGSSTCLGGGGVKPVNGSVAFLSSSATTETVTHTLIGQGSVENNSLEAAGNKVIVEGGLALLKLASGLKWSFHA
ncbi:MAG TPA: hypothetical protein VGL37_09100 [Solirubrobacteraceae bacterium]|jgi:hypothetical protein